jgi:hypothetical protein
MDLIAMDHHKEKSIAKIVLTLIISTTIALLFYCYKPLNNTFEILSHALEISGQLQPIIFCTMIIVAASHIGTYFSNFIVKSTCKYMYGDPEFYLTEKRARALADKIAAETEQDVDPNTIFRVVDFCRDKYRRQSTGEIGSNPEDWRRSLERLIYYGDIEHFVEQQELIKRQELSIERKLLAIEHYNRKIDACHSMHSMHSMQNLKDQHVPIPMPPPPPPAPPPPLLPSQLQPMMLEQLDYYTSSDYDHSSESTPLLLSQKHARNSYTQPCLQCENSEEDLHTMPPKKLININNS